MQHSLLTASGSGTNETTTNGGSGGTGSGGQYGFNGGNGLRGNYGGDSGHYEEGGTLFTDKIHMVLEVMVKEDMLVIPVMVIW